MAETTNKINEVVPCMTSHYDTNLLAEELYLKVPPTMPGAKRLRGVFTDTASDFMLQDAHGPAMHELVAAYSADGPHVMSDHLTLLRSLDPAFIKEVRDKLIDLVFARERLAGRWRDPWNE